MAVSSTGLPGIIKMSLCVVSANDFPEGVTETGLGIMLFFDRSVGSVAQPASTASNTVKTVAKTVISVFIVLDLSSGYALIVPVSKI